MRFWSLLFFISMFASANDNQFKDFEAIGHAISTDMIKMHEASGGAVPINGSYFEGFVPQKDIYDCVFHPEEDDGTETRYEVLMVARGNTQVEKSTPEPSIFENPGSYLTGYTAMYTYHHQNSLSEANLATAIANEFKSLATEEEKLSALRGLNAALNEVYNNSRNPGLNNDENNPNQEALPPGDMTLNQMLDAAYRGDKFRGPVCNDISEGVAMIAEQVFPDKDVLVINQGTHHVVAISDGKVSRLIGDSQDKVINHLAINPTYAASNIRVSKMDGGILKEIAVVDTQSGQLLEQAFKTGRPLLKTGVDISSLVTEFNVINESKDGRTHALNTAVAVGDLNESRMYLVVAKYDYKTRNGGTYVGLGASGTQHITSGDMRYQLHLRYGSEINVVNYVSPNVDLKLTGGLSVEAMAGTKTSQDSANKNDVSLDVSPLARAHVAVRPSDKVSINTNLEVRSSIGPENWGELTGRFSGGTASGVAGILENTNFHLNQIYATSTLQANLSPKAVASASVKYQGSKIGQALDVGAGLQIATNSGARIMIFTGLATTQLPGYETKHSLLKGTNGAYLRAGYETAAGVVFSGTLSNIAPKQTPALQFNVEAPLTPKKTKK